MIHKMRLIRLLSIDFLSLGLDGLIFAQRLDGEFTADSSAYILVTGSLQANHELYHELFCSTSVANQFIRDCQYLDGCDPEEAAYNLIESVNSGFSV